MKKISIAFILLAIIVLMVTTIKAENFTNSKSEIIVKNLSAGLSSDNLGLRTSSALVLGNLIEMKYMNTENAKAAVFSLMTMLNKGNTDEEKISAALALYKIGDARGIYKLKRAAKFDESERVKKICYMLYCSYHKQNGSEYLLNY